MTVFFDTNVLIYTLAQRDPARQGTALRLLSTGGFVSAQVLNEFASVAHRKLKMSWPTVRAALKEVRLALASPLPITVTTTDAALLLVERHKLAFYDALIVASALEAMCTTLYTEDMHHGLTIEGRLTVVNPFLASSFGSAT